MYAEKIIELRLKNDWTQAQLAEHSGISQSMIANYENGSPLSQKGLRKLAKAFGISVETLTEVKRAKKQENIRGAANRFNLLAKEAQTLPYEFQVKIMEYMSDMLKLREYSEKSDKVQSLFGSKKK